MILGSGLCSCEATTVERQGDGANLDAPERPFPVYRANVALIEPGPDAAPANWNGIVQRFTSEVVKDTQIDADLWWYWNDAKGDMGLHAAPLEPATGGDSDAADDRRIAAASRYRATELCLGALPEVQVRLLEMVHRPIPPALRPRLAPLGSLAHVLIDDHGPEWVLTQLHENGAELTKAMAKARAKVTRALEAYRSEMEQWRKATGRQRARRSH